jgi:hypothetical protein
MAIIDTPFNTTAKIRLLAQGVRMVIRYYNFNNSMTFPEKCLQLAEAQALAAKGVATAVVFQQRQNQVGDFSEPQGLAAGRRAYRHPQDAIGQPSESAIYFSVDFDATSPQRASNVLTYFEGVKRAFAEESGGVPVSASTDRLVCGALKKRGLIEFVWLPMSRGFAGTREALEAGEFHLAQRAPAATLCGLRVDFNDANPNRADFGAFTVATDVPAPLPNGSAAERHPRRGTCRFAAARGARRAVRHHRPPSIGQTVFVMSVTE